MWSMMQKTRTRTSREGAGKEPSRGMPPQVLV
jgi:hypothetical protein